MFIKIKFNLKLQLQKKRLKDIVFIKIVKVPDKKTGWTQDNFNVVSIELE